MRAWERMVTAEMKPRRREGESSPESYKERAPGTSRKDFRLFLNETSTQVQAQSPGWGRAEQSPFPLSEVLADQMKCPKAELAQVIMVSGAE